jgi:hypothetical protein
MQRQLTKSQTCRQVCEDLSGEPSTAELSQDPNVRDNPTQGADRFNKRILLLLSLFPVKVSGTKRRSITRMPTPSFLLRARARANGVALQCCVDRHRSTAVDHILLYQAARIERRETRSARFLSNKVEFGRTNRTSKSAVIPPRSKFDYRRSRVHAVGRFRSCHIRLVDTHWLLR